MSASASQVQSKMTLKKARARLCNGIVEHDHKKLKEAITEVQTLGGSLNQPWSRPADACDDVRPPIVLAAYLHNLEAMRLLLNTNTIDLNFESGGVGKTPVMLHACRTGNEKVVGMLLRRGGSINVQASYNTLPLDAAFFASMKFHYSVIFHSDWGSLELKRRLIAWWQGGEFTPDAPLRARWPGAIPLVALLLKNGANPAIEDTSGISPLKAVRDPTCLLKNAETLMTVELRGVVKFISHNEGILTFQIMLKDRMARGRKLEVMVDADYNMPLPADVDASVTSDILDILASKKTRTMRGLIEAYAPKQKSAEGMEVKASQEVVELKLRVERVEVAQHAQGKQQLQDQHVIEFAREEKAYRERMFALKEHGNPSIRMFFNTFAVQLDTLFQKCKLDLNLDPTNGKNLDKAEKVMQVIGFAIKLAPSPFDVVGKVIERLGQAYISHKKHAARFTVVDLLERDHGKMCDDLAYDLCKRFEPQLEKMSADQAKDLANYGVGAVLALMCANGSEEDEIVLDRSQSSFKAIQEKMSQAITAPTKASAKFHKKLEEYAPSRVVLIPEGLPKSQEPPKEPSKRSFRSYLPGFRSKSPAPLVPCAPAAAEGRRTPFPGSPRPSPELVPIS